MDNLNRFQRREFQKLYKKIERQQKVIDKQNLINQRKLELANERARIAESELKEKVAEQKRQEILIRKQERRNEIVKRKAEREKIKRIKKLNEKNTKLVKKLVAKKDKKKALVKIFEQFTDEQRKKLKLTLSKILKMNGTKGLLKYIENQSGEKIGYDVRVIYTISEITFSKNITLYLNRDASYNDEMIKVYAGNEFYKSAFGDDDHYGRATITEIIGNHRHIYIDPLDITRHLMRFSEDNDCVFHTIYNEIKDFRGYKRYTIEKLKQEFIGCGINITDGVCFEDIKKWHSVFKHHISFYFFNPNFILVEKVKGYDYNYKTPQILLMYNNNHCYTINNNDIKNSVVYGNVTDLNQFNPATTFEIKAGDNYTFHTFNEVSDDIINNNFKEGVLFVEPRIIVDEMGIERFQTFLQFVHWLLTIDRTQINFIDFDKNCVYFNNILIFVVKDFNLRKGICDFLKRETESLNFNFKNQSYGSITMNWFNERYGYLKKSCYNNKMRHFVDEYYPEPVHLSFSTTKKWSVKLGIDYPKSYPNAVVKYFKDIGGYRVLDEEVIKKGSESSGLKFKISDEVSSNRLAITCLNDKKKIFIKYKKIGKKLALVKARERVLKDYGEFDESWF